MGIVIGIDVGISTTKIVGLREGRVLSPIRITAADQVTSLYGAFGKYLHDNKIELKDVEQVMLTGVGAGFVQVSAQASLMNSYMAFQHRKSTSLWPMVLVPVLRAV